MRLANYEGEKRFVGIWYEATNATISDGRTQRTFSFYQAYQPFVEHWSVRYYLAKHNADLGSDDGFASHLLILDTAESKIYLAEQEQGRKLLDTQLSKATEADKAKAKEEVEKMLKELKESNSLADFQRLGMFEFFAPAEDRSSEVRAMIDRLDKAMPEEAKTFLRRQFG